MKKRTIDPLHKPARRSFLMGLGAAAATGAAFPGSQTSGASPEPVLPNLLRQPDRVSVFGEAKSSEVLLTSSANTWQAAGVELSVERKNAHPADEVALFLSAPKIHLTRIRLRWHGSFPEDWRYLGDHWERSYGDLEFRGLVGDRLMPWYFLATDGRFAQATGVKTGASSICYWQVDAAGVTLWLDVSNGGSGVQLGDRRLHTATVIQRQAHPSESPFDLARSFCQSLCDRPLLPAQPVFGSNNWYYLYGENTSAQRSLEDASLLAELVPRSVANRPFCVIDMGWHAARDGAGPASQTSKSYPDMSALAAKMTAMHVRPGIWTRPTLTADPKAQLWRLPPAGGRPQGDLIALDPTIPEARNYIAENIAILCQWGYELVKFDYSTFDLLGRWGFQMGESLTDAGWHFHDRSRTNAEIISDLYRAIREAAGRVTLIGCNTLGHLAAGLVEVQRIGDDTSGREWSRTRKMGVNTLAFRLPQHNTFFAADADCVPVTNEIPWDLTQQWLDLVARSGTALFVSVDPAVVKPAQKRALQSALATASQKQQPGIPLDWQETTTPERWTLDSKPTLYNWYKGD
ncbi:MAG: hypothetical protein WCE61_05155 [Candidatus Acidiferrum sp.]